MSKKNRVRVVERIVGEFYERKRAPERDEMLQEKFVEWFTNDLDSAQKEAALYYIWEEEQKQEQPITEETRETIKKLMSRLDIEREEQRAVRGLYKERESLPKVSKKSSRPRLWIRIAAVATFLLFVGSGVFMLNYFKGEQPPVIVEYVVPKGAVENLQLADQSQVWLNAESELTITQDKNQRLAELSGESLFEVAKEKKRPFVVKTNGLMLKVVGTKFNVSAYPEATEVIVKLIEGSVVAHSEEGEWSLVANQQLNYNRQTKEVVVSEIESDGDMVDSWTSGVVNCELSTLQEIFRAIERSYDIEIVVESPERLPEVRYTTQFDVNKPVEDALKVLEIVTEAIEFELTDEGIYIVTPTN